MWVEPERTAHRFHRRRPPPVNVAATAGTGIPAASIAIVSTAAAVVGAAVTAAGRPASRGRACAIPGCSCGGAVFGLVESPLDLGAPRRRHSAPQQRPEDVGLAWGRGRGKGGGAVGEGGQQRRMKRQGLRPVRAAREGEGGHTMGLALAHCAFAEGEGAKIRFKSRPTSVKDTEIAPALGRRPWIERPPTDVGRIFVSAVRQRHRRRVRPPLREEVIAAPPRGLGAGDEQRAWSPEFDTTPPEAHQSARATGQLNVDQALGPDSDSGCRTGASNGIK